MVFDVLILVMNWIGEEVLNGVVRLSCEELENGMMEWEEVREGVDEMGVLFVLGDVMVLEISGDEDGDGLGFVRFGVGSGSGLGSGVGGLKVGLGWLVGLGLGVVVLL